jgi:mannose-6-phosphate isomerase-like protein (cupin superfamily)
MRKVAVWVVLLLSGLFLLQSGCERTRKSAPESLSQQPALLGDPSLETRSWVRDPAQPPNLSTYDIHLKQMSTFYDVPGEYGYVLEGGNHGFESLSFILTETHPGGGPPLHRHGCEEAHILLEGWARYIIGERTFDAQAPYVVRIPANVPHTFMNTGDRVFRLIAVLPGQKISYAELGPNPLLKKNP